MKICQLNDNNVAIELVGNELAMTAVLILEDGRPKANVRIVLPKTFEEKLKRMPNVENQIYLALLQVIAMGVTDEDFARVAVLRKTPKISN